MRIVAFVFVVMTLSSGAVLANENPSKFSDESPGAATVRAFADGVAAARAMPASENDRQSALRATLAKYVNFDYVSRAGLGQYWDTLTPENRVEMSVGLRDHLAKKIAVFLFARGRNAIVFARPAAPNMGTNPIVSAMLNLSPGSSMPLLFRLDGKSEQPQISDITIAGVSMIQVLAAECQSVIRREGFPALLARIAD